MLTEHDLDLLVAPTTGPSWKIDLVNGDHYAGSKLTGSCCGVSAHYRTDGLY